MPTIASINRARSRCCNVATPSTSPALAKTPARICGGVSSSNGSRGLSPEIDNLRVAQSWAIDHGDLDLALTVVVPLCVNGTAVGYTAFEWAGPLATDPEVDLRPLGSTLLAGSVHAIAGDFERATALDARRSTSESALGIEPSFDSYEATFAIAVFSPNPASALDLCRRCVQVDTRCR